MASAIIVSSDREAVIHIDVKMSELRTVVILYSKMSMLNILK